MVEAFDAAAGAVSLLRLADQEAVDQWGGRIGERPPGTGGGHVGDDGVGAQGESADGFSIDFIGFEEFKDCVPGEPASNGVERSGAAVDVIIANCPGGELELAEAEAEPGEKEE